MTSSVQQRLIIAGVTSVIVVLTIITAFLLALNDQPSVIVQETMPPATESPILTPTNTLPPLDTATPSPSPTLTETMLTPTETTMPPTETATFTPAPPTETPTITPTPDICEKPASWVDYTVQRGDTYDELAQRIGSSVFELQQINCLRNTTLRPGQIIYLPILPPAPTPTDTATPIPSSTPAPRQDPAATLTPTPDLPLIERVVPRQGTLGNQVTLNLFGRNFGLLDKNAPLNESYFSVELQLERPNAGSVVRTLDFIENTRTSTSLQVIIPANLPAGCYSLQIVNPDGRFDIEQAAYSNTEQFPVEPFGNEFRCGPIGTVTPTPTPSTTPTPSPISITANSCDPASGPTGQQDTITCTGQGFDPIASLTAEFQLNSNNDTAFRLDIDRNRSTANTLVAVIPGNLTPGTYNLFLQNDTRSDIEFDAYTAQ